MRKQRRRRRGPIGSGRIRIKLARLLSEELGRDVFPENIWEQNHNAFYGQISCARWGWTWREPGFSFNSSGSCWDTMSECVKKGIILDDENGIKVAISKE